MDISVELVITILLGILAMSAPPILCTILFRVLVKEGVPLDCQEFRCNRRSGSLFWLGLFLLNLFIIFFVSNDSTPDRLQAAYGTFEYSLILVLCWFLLVLALRRKFYDGRKRLESLRSFPVDFFIFVNISWLVPISQHINRLRDSC